MTARLETATLAALVLLSLAIYVVYSRLNRFSVKRIRGPDAPFWLGECNFSQPITRSLMSRDHSICAVISGNVRDFDRQANVGDMDFQYARDYGLVWRMGGVFGVRHFLLAHYEIISLTNSRL